MICRPLDVVDTLIGMFRGELPVYAQSHWLLVSSQIVAGSQVLNGDWEGMLPSPESGEVYWHVECC